MKDFYYQIKGKKSEHDGLSNWAFPPIFSGKVTAKDSKEAKKEIHEVYEKKFPSRVLKNDLDSNAFLLSVEEIKPGSHIEKYFQLQTCEVCSATYYLIDKYNDSNCDYKGITYCSFKCKELGREYDRFKRTDNSLLLGGSPPVIYKISNKVTKKVYIGKTAQVFTLRWYQHFFQTGSNKFHNEIRKTDVTNWTFEVIEIIQFPQEIREMKDINTYLDDREKFIIDRERFWINHFNSITEGYNSI
jgi:hypothetical protein